MVPHNVGEGHPGCHPAGLSSVDVSVERLTRGLPVELSAEAKDTRVVMALCWNDIVPVAVVVDATAVDAVVASHVALAR